MIKQRITHGDACGDMDIFLFEWSTGYLKSEHSKQVRYPVEQNKRNSISQSNHVLFCLLYKSLTNKKKPTVCIHFSKEDALPMIHAWCLIAQVTCQQPIGYHKHT